MITSSPAFGLALSIVFYNICQSISKKTGWIILNPLLISTILIILVLSLFSIEYSDYNNGGRMISFFLNPATVLLAVPIYRSWLLLKSNLLTVLTGILMGSISSIMSVVTLGRLIGLDNVIILSLLPKSVTTPIGLEISGFLGGNSSLTVVAIIMTGISGAVFGSKILSSLGINDEIAVGVAFGTASHAIGTSKALEVGKIQGAFSGMAIGIMGLATTGLVLIFAEWIVKYIN